MFSSFSYPGGDANIPRGAEISLPDSDSSKDFPPKRAQWGGLSWHKDVKDYTMEAGSYSPREAYQGKCLARDVDY
jgi:hypothetical protein